MLADVVNPATPNHCSKAATTTPCFGGSSTIDFADPTSFGEQRRNQFTGPGYFNTDLSVLKGFKVPGLESGKFQVGAQAYNVLNHPNFQNPDFDVSSPTFGSIVTTAVRRPVSSVRSWVATRLRVLSNSKRFSSSDVSGEVCAVCDPFAEPTLKATSASVVGFCDVESPHFVLQRCALKPETFRSRSRARDSSRRRF
jgi:hypothetical protein